ncbi:hypothetical protein LN650_18790 [Klebsiella pneumoniae subsp. pneumoniae]|nr:hypothetical protein [Klebsiella pneumoniae subsp. pneumoniae]
MLTDYSQLPLAERNVLRRLFTGRRPAALWRTGRGCGAAYRQPLRADVTRMGATKETDQLIAELSQQSVEFAVSAKP